MNKLTISVTEDDIRRGKPEEPDCCPIALAYEKKTGHDCHVSDRYLLDQVTQESYLLPYAAQVFITRFDWEHDVKPFSFEVEDQGGASCASD